MQQLLEKGRKWDQTQKPFRHGEMLSYGGLQQAGLCHWYELANIFGFEPVITKLSNVNCSYISELVSHASREKLMKMDVWMSS